MIPKHLPLLIKLVKFFNGSSILNSSNIIYLLSNDINTIKEISDLCGNTKIGKEIKPLITPEELKCLDIFEAVILCVRMHPFRTKLIPDYKIEWNLSYENKKMDDRKVTEIKIFNL